VGRRKAAAPAQIATIAGLTSALDGTDFASVPPEDEPRRDPAQVVAEVMLAAVLSGSGPTLDDARAPGAVIAVVLKSADWLDPVRRAWRREVSGELLTRNTKRPDL
jgi:hypothetical protein